MRAVPSVGWSLLVKLLPKAHDSVSPTQKPKFAEASPGGQETLTYGIVWATQAAVVELAVEHAKLVPERWQTLIGILGQLQPDSFEHAVRGLEDCLDRQGAEDRFATWDALRKELNRHGAFTGIDWAIKDERLGRLDDLVSKFKPNDPILVSTWLFDDWRPDIVGCRDEDDPMVAIQAARFEALKAVMVAEGSQGLTKLAARVKRPLQMAETLAKLELGEEDSLSMLRQILAVSGEAKSLASVIVAQAFASFGSSWIKHLNKLRAELNISDEESACLFLALEDGKPTWDIVASFGADVDDAYWQLKRAFSLRGTSEEMEYAVARYRACGRTVAAIEATHERLQDMASASMVSLLEAAIPEINAIVGGGGAMLGYYVEHLFEELEKRPDVSQEDLARMEFAYLPLIHGRKQPLTIYRMLVESPEFFVSAICTVFKPASGEAPIVSEQEQKMATAAYKLLNGLNVLPGQSDDRVDFATLKAWSDEVRQRAALADRSAITDARIGHLLAHAPEDPDDHAWPHKAVRQLIEELSSDEVEQAVRIGRFNMRGVFSKAIGEGGQQERALADQAKDWARALPEFPRTTNMLFAIAEMWFREGEAADARAAKDALRW